MCEESRQCSVWAAREGLVEGGGTWGRVWGWKGEMETY